MDEEPRIKIQQGRPLAPIEEAALVQLIDGFMDVPAINAARHASDDADELATHIEALLTGAGWYPQ